MDPCNFMFYIVKDQITVQYSLCNDFPSAATISDKRFATWQLYFTNFATLLRNYLFAERKLCSFELILLAAS